MARNSNQASKATNNTGAPLVTKQQVLDQYFASIRGHNVPAVQVAIALQAIELAFASK